MPSFLPYFIGHADHLTWSPPLSPGVHALVWSQRDTEIMGVILVAGDHSIACSCWWIVWGSMMDADVRAAVNCKCRSSRSLSRAKAFLLIVILLNLFQILHFVVLFVYHCNIVGQFYVHKHAFPQMFTSQKHFVNHISSVIFKSCLFPLWSLIFLGCSSIFGNHSQIDMQV